VRDAELVISFGTYDADFTLRTGAEPVFVERSKSNPSLRVEDLKSAYELRYPDRILFAASDHHTWLSIPNAQVMVRIIRDALSAEDPDNADIYRANADRYLGLLSTTDAEIRALVATIPEGCRVLVSDIEFLTYYGDSYGLTTVGPAVSPFGNQAEAAQKDRDKMVTLIRRSPVKSIFAHEGHADDVAPVSAAVGANVIELYADELGDPGSGADSYVGLMRTNTSLIVEALRSC
jgi:manganese/zinc/iron transport system substrate-binding protein